MTATGGDWVDVTFEVQKPDDGKRVDAFLTARLHKYSRVEVQALIEEGRVSARGRAAKASTRVANGDVVIVRYPKREDPPASVENLDVIFEDDWLLAVNKPAGVLSHPTDKVVANTVTSLLKKRYPDMVPRLAHRLDRETSGVLLLAKDADTARLLFEAFSERKIQKEYLAIVLGRVAWKRKVVDVPIGREDAEIKVRQSAGEGDAALTEFELVEARDDFSLVTARPKTGRLHQIRVHLAHVGHPVAGDKLYIGEGEAYLKAVRQELTHADKEALGAQRQLLHARALTLKHPISDKPLTISAPVPPDFKALFP